MRKIIIIILSLWYGLPVYALPPMPEAISNNAVAVAINGKQRHLCSFFGLMGNKKYDGVTNRAWCVDIDADDDWQEVSPVPVKSGRLASTAVSIAGKIYVFGGYTVAADGHEVSTPEVVQYNPITNQYKRRADMPVPVDDSVAVTWHNRYIIFISGWHQKDNVQKVQVYDALENRWHVNSDYPGVAVFGHFASVSENHILVCDGVKVVVDKKDAKKRSFVASDECWRGNITDAKAQNIKWSKITHHNRPSRYRAASHVLGSKALVIGGSENPYNYNGIGYDGIPSQPVSDVIAYDFVNNTWSSYDSGTTAGMDYRGAFQLGSEVCTVGGMLANQKLTAEVICRAQRSPVVTFNR